MPTAAQKMNAVGTNQNEAASQLVDVTGRMHGLLMERPDALMAALRTAQRRPSPI